MVPFVVISLIDLETGDTLEQMSDFEGQTVFEDLEPHLFSVRAKFPEYEFPEIDSLKFEDYDSNTLVIQAIPCEIDYPLKNCPKGHSTKRVIRAMGDLMVSYTFRSKRGSIRYSRIVARRGYESTRLQSGEFLYRLADEEMNERLLQSSICDRLLYCKKHNILFD